jgi:hypothetical protein
MEYKNTLALFYVVIFGQFLNGLLSCDLQRIFSSSIGLQHLLVALSVFFIITTLDTKMLIPEALKNTAIVYVLYILSTKSKAISVVPMLLLLTADQMIKIYLDTQDDIDPVVKTRLEKARSVLTGFILLLIVGGFIWYFIRAKMEFGDEFDYRKFIMGTNKCSHKK